MRKGQSAVEFIVLVGVMFLFFGVSIVYVQSLLVDFTQANKVNQLYGVRDAAVQEIALASRMPAGYVRTFTLPATIEGISYRIELQPEAAPLKDAVRVLTADTETFVFLDYDVSGTLQPGQNTIRKGTTITVN